MTRRMVTQTARGALLIRACAPLGTSARHAHSTPGRAMNMSTYSLRLRVAIVVVVALAANASRGQSSPAPTSSTPAAQRPRAPTSSTPPGAQRPPPPAPAPATRASPTTQGAATFKPEELEQIAAQIALYPDPIVAQVLMASTYPLEVV